MKRRRSGFTLIEILVVLAISAFVASIVIGGFKEMNTSNKRTTCQTNLVQIYQGLRQYAADEGGQFPRGPGDTLPSIGLWGLYTFPDSTSLIPDPTKPTNRYLRSVKVLHCPSDPQIIPARDTADNYNVNYLSYQLSDSGTQTYQLKRTDTKRQLLNTDSTGNLQTTPDRTVITWCKHHRTTRRDYDNVLFSDGTVQFIPRQQKSDDATDCGSTLPISTVPCTLTGAQRAPKPLPQ